MSLQPYNPNAKCAACGSTDIATSLCKGHAMHTQPLMHRTCRNCGNAWDETPLDAPTEFGPNKIIDGDLKKSLGS